MPQREIFSDDKYNKLCYKYNYSKQELQNYEESMRNYQTQKTFDYLMENTLNEENKKIKDLRVYKFKNLTIESYIKECITTPLRTLYNKTCSRFV